MQIMLIIAIVAAALAALIIYDAIRVYRQTPGTSPMTAFHNSATIALSRLGSLGSLIVAAIVSLSSYLGDPNISGAVQTALGSINPALVPFIPVVILVLAEFARRRTLNKD
jgi:membrane protein DedA with SNARE-associated domain